MWQAAAWILFVGAHLFGAFGCLGCFWVFFGWVDCDQACPCPGSRSAAYCSRWTDVQMWWMGGAKRRAMVGIFIEQGCWCCIIYWTGTVLLPVLGRIFTGSMRCAWMKHRMENSYRLTERMSCGLVIVLFVTCIVNQAL